MIAHAEDCACGTGHLGTAHYGLKYIKCFGYVGYLE